MNQWRWISPEVLFAIHDVQLAEHGGIDGIKDINLVQSALARPQQQLADGKPPPDAAALAAAYACGIVRNHGFCDGNKRTAWIAARLFLLDNGFKLRFEQPDAIEVVVGLASGVMSEAQFATWLRERISTSGAAGPEA